VARQGNRWGYLGRHTVRPEGAVSHISVILPVVRIVDRSWQGMVRLEKSGTMQGDWMFQQMSLTAANDARIYRDARADQSWSGTWSRAHDPSRLRARRANLVLSCLCSVVAFLAIDNTGDRSLLFEQYDFKLWSYEDRLVRFCLAVLPSLLGMALLLVAYKAISILRSCI
jgi:hypothetical protein